MSNFYGHPGRAGGFPGLVKGKSPASKPAVNCNYFTETNYYAVAHSPPDLLSALDGAVLERWANCSGCIARRCPRSTARVSPG